MKICLNINYKENKANIAGITFSDWKSPIVISSKKIIKNDIETYNPEELYKKELSCLLELLQTYELSEINTIIIDGYVYADGNKKQETGAYLYEALDKKIPVIGISKIKRYEYNLVTKIVFRGDSSDPLYITSVGIDEGYAAFMIKNMHGELRIPTLLQEAEKLSKRW